MLTVIILFVLVLDKLKLGGQDPELSLKLDDYTTNHLATLTSKQN
jgi:hypothetical protein